MRVAVADRAGNDGSDGGSCEKLLGVRRESRGELDGEICTVRFFRATLRLDDWCLGGPQPVSRDVECDSVLAVEPARFQFSQCAPEGVAHYATDSCVRVRLSRLWSLVSPVLVLLGCCEWLAGQDSSYWSGTGNADPWVVTVGDVVFGRWLCKHLSRRLEMPRHLSRLGLNHRTYTLSELLCAMAFWHLEEVPGECRVVELSLPVGLSEVAMFVVGRCSHLVACDLGGCAENCLCVVADSVGLGPVWPVVPFWLVVLLCVAWLWNKAVRLVSVVQQRYSGGVSTWGELDGEICTVRFFRATLRLDDWRLGGPQPVSRDVKCDSVLAVEPARFQFSQCAPEGVAHYATNSCVLYRL
ncbi:hypothetical protein Taro_046545 [Colocasia esculenta]|uniref:Uncharacterized protein n=1 Tax=Colocasia esculenta TaxID=4460 RepID=A0A843WZ33_COLES|nr:hypothetical protein [Colocasia esculenta]